MLAALWLAVGAASASAPMVVRTIRVGGAVGVSSDGTDAWVSGGRKRVDEIDTSTGTVVRTIPLVDASAVSSDGTHVWVTGLVENGYNDFTFIVSEIDASTGTVVRTIPVGNAPEVVSSDGTHVWVTNGGDNSASATVSEIDASTGRVVKTIKVGLGPEGVSSDGTHVWVTNQGDGTVSEIEIGFGGTGGSGSPACVVPRLGHMILAAAMRALLRAHCTLGSVRKPKHPGRQQVLRVSRQSAVPGSRHRTAYKVNIALV